MAEPPDKRNLDSSINIWRRIPQGSHLTPTNSREQEISLCEVIGIWEVVCFCLPRLESYSIQPGLSLSNENKKGIYVYLAPGKVEIMRLGFRGDEVEEKLAL